METAQLLGLYALFFCVNGLFNKIVLHSLDVETPLLENINLAVITNAANLILPATSGAAVRGVFLKKKYQFPYASFIGTMTGTYALSYLLILSSSAAAVVHYYTHEPEKFHLSVAVLLSIGILSLFCLIVLSPWLKSYLHFNSTLSRIIECTANLTRRPKIILKLSALIVANICIGIFLLRVGMDALGAELSAWDSLFISSINTLGVLVRITPGNIGVTEAIMGITGTILGYQANTLVLCSLLLRAANILVALILFPICCFSLFGRNWLSQLKTFRT